MEIRGGIVIIPSGLEIFRNRNITRRKLVRETLLNFQESWNTWTSWRLFSIILIVFDVQ